MRTEPRSKLLRSARQRPVTRFASRRMIFLGETSLRRAISEYVVHYHEERAHQGIGNERIERFRAMGDGEVVCDERLGGLLKCYRRGVVRWRCSEAKRRSRSVITSFRESARRTAAVIRVVEQLEVSFSAGDRSRLVFWTARRRSRFRTIRAHLDYFSGLIRI